MIEHNSREVVDSVSAIVATYERKELLSNMIGSFRQRYPNLEFVVADNSVNKYPRFDVEYISVKANSGISLSRNLALERVEKPFVMLVDDDTVCVEDTNISKMLDYLCKYNLDIVAGDMLERDVNDRFFFHGSYQFICAGNKRILYHYVEIPNKKNFSDGELFDVTPNFFVARTDAVREIAWDNNLKYACEHDDFFIKAMMEGKKVAFLSNSKIINNPSVKHYGGERGKNCKMLFLKKWNIDDKIEIRWIREPVSRLSFYSIARNECFVPDEKLLMDASANFLRFFPDFKLD